MSKGLRDILISTGILAGILLCLVLTWRSVGRTQEAARLLERKTDDLAELRVMANDLEADRRILEAIGAMPGDRPPSLSALAERALPDVAVEIRALEPRAALEGWRLERVAIDIHSVAYDRIAPFIETARTQRPPWRLQEWSMTPTSEAGRGGVRLVFAALVPPSAGDEGATLGEAGP